jgi:hypothetical protein
MDAIGSKELDGSYNEAVPWTIEALTAPGTDEPVSSSHKNEEQRDPKEWKYVKNPILAKDMTKRSDDSLLDGKEYYCADENQPSVPSILAPSCDVASGMIHLIHQSK